MTRLRIPMSSAIRSFYSDLKSDPFLRYILLVVVILTVYGVWFRLPNFGGPDEYSRLIQPMKVAGQFIADPGLASFQMALTDGRALGATFYLYALVLAPVFLLVLLSGQLGAFVSLGALESRWDLWHATPEWFWEVSIVLGRLTTVLFAVGCVYLVFRMGRELRDAWTGRLAAVLVTLSAGFVSEAHLIGEDIPMLFFLLLSFLFVFRFLDSDDHRQLWIASFAGGVAIAFKLSGGIAAVTIGIAYIMSLLGDWPSLERGSILSELKIPLVGACFGLFALLFGFPSVLLAGPEALITRIVSAIGTKTGTSPAGEAPIYVWFLGQYFRGLGPLFISAVVGVGIAGYRLVRYRHLDHRVTLLLLAVGAYLAVYSSWNFVRVRHLLPTFPLLLVVFAVMIRDTPALVSFEGGGHSGHTRRLMRGALAILMISSAVFAGIGVLQYTNDPRDSAVSWMSSNVDTDESMEVYENSVADVAVIHGTPVRHYDFAENESYSDDLVLDESAFTRWMLGKDRRHSKYIQLTASDVRPAMNDDSEMFSHPERSRYIAALMEGRTNYSIVAEFGDRPAGPSDAIDLASAAKSPYAAGVEEYVVILERTG